jgi:hypothetical protein
MKTSLTRISFHLVCLFRRPSRWRFFAAGIAREFSQWMAIAIAVWTARCQKNLPGPASHALRFS